MSEWIKCSERMPDDGVRVRVAGVSLHDPAKSYWTMEAEYRSGDTHDGWYDEEDPLDTYPVTHWMPLPAPPVQP